MTDSPMPFPLENILNDISLAIKAQLYYPALLVTLTIPEICCALALDNSIFVKEKHYADFVDKYTTPEELGIDGLGCYRLRGGVVHRGNAAGHQFFGATQVIFTIPETKRRIHALSFIDKETDKVFAMFDLGWFCNAMTLAAKKWYQEHKNDPVVAKNMENLIIVRDSGMTALLSKGVPVLGSGS